MTAIRFARRRFGTVKCYHNRKQVAVLEITTPKCPSCQSTEQFEVPTDGWLKWRMGGGDVHEALPDLTASQRERLVTGLCPDCWERTMGTELVEEEASDEIHELGDGRTVVDPDPGAPALR